MKIYQRIYTFRVDVSLDDGKNFTRADLIEKPIKQRRRSEWSWIFFEKTIPIPEDLRKRHHSQITSRVAHYQFRKPTPPSPTSYRMGGGAHWAKIS